MTRGSARNASERLAAHLRAHLQQSSGRSRPDLDEQIDAAPAATNPFSHAWAINSISSSCNPNFCMVARSSADDSRAGSSRRSATLQLVISIAAARAFSP